jgi:hypothetical protein
MKPARVPVEWERSLDTFRRKGLTNADIAEAMRIARDRQADDPWAYACGILWNLVDERSRLGNVMAEVWSP